MGRETGIEWAAATWSPVVGCRRISPGCENCYAETLAGRFCKKGQPYEGFVKLTPSGPRWTGKVALRAERLAVPLLWRKPVSGIFVNSQSDTFHEDLTREEIASIFGAMAASPHHRFLVLTKRAQWMRAWLDWARDQWGDNVQALIEHAATSILYSRENAGGSEWNASLERMSERLFKAANDRAGVREWTLKNVRLGVSVESQKYADERLPELAEIRRRGWDTFVSCEPLLEPVNLEPWLGDFEKRSSIGWVIVGGESGKGARPMAIEWARSIVRQCQEALVPVFVKQLGARPVCVRGARADADFEVVDRKGGDPAEWPEDLRVRELVP